MKKLLLSFIAILLILPGVALAQSETLSRAEINRLANSVVLVVKLDGNGEPLGSGSGTIVSPTGTIYTNQHVVEGGADFAILTLEQMGEPAALSYFASATMIHSEVDFAVLQIDRDADGMPINPDALNLPYVSLTNTQPDIGDAIFVFGYPDIGDLHMVVTSGSITTIQNETLNGERIPFWYQTDAQFSPGNSGGLAVNLSGRMVGIPTQVRAEDRTLGRLGGVLSVTAIRGALESQRSVAAPTAPASNNNNSNNTAEQALTINIDSVEHDYTHNDALGMMIHTSANAVGYKDVPLRAAVFLYWDDDSPVIANNRAPISATTSSWQLTNQQVLTPSYDNTVYDDVWFFIPYSFMPDGRIGTYTAYIEAQLGVDGESFTAFSNLSFFDYTYPDRQLTIDLTDIQHNVERNGLVGMEVHTHIQTLNYRGETLRVGLFVYWDDGTPIEGNASSPAANRTTSGYLTVQDTITPSYDDSEWPDFWFFLPYDYFPDGLTGAQDAYAEVEIGIDGEGFTSWSRSFGFTINYN